MDEEEPLQELPVAAPISKVYDSTDIIPEGFNAQCIALDGHLRASMDWTKQRKQALELVENGLRLFWDLDLGLFQRLDKPLADSMQFQALTLALEHFRDTLWQEFKTSTVGLCLYRGRADLSEQWVWDDVQKANFQTWQQKHVSTKSSLYCADVASEYLGLLAGRMPDAMPLFVLFDVAGEGDPLTCAQLVSHERFERYHIAVKNGHGVVYDYGWEGTPAKSGFIGRQLSELIAPGEVGVCLPERSQGIDSFARQLSAALQALQRHSICYRVIPESELITSWDGLDYLLFVPEGLSMQGKRKLKGFCAAGGTAVTAGEKIGLPLELSVDEFLRVDVKN